MANELITTDPRDVADAKAAEARPQMVAETFGGRQALPSTGMNVGSVSIEQERAIAETQGKILVAQRFRRSISGMREELQMACSSEAFAETAFYTVPNRGHGPSIRFAEEVARIYGNFDYGHREFSRHIGTDAKDEDGNFIDPGFSEVEVYAWDMEKNNYSRRQITVQHVLDTRQGPRRLKDQADIDNKIANVASKQMRGRILALVSKALVSEGVELCKKTLAGGGKGDKPLAVRIQTMQSAFAKEDVTVAMLETKLGHKLEETTVDELADLRGILVSIKDGGKVSEYFSGNAAAEGEPLVAGAQPAPKEQPKEQPKKEAAKAETPKQDAPKAEAAQERPQEADKPVAATTVAEQPAQAAAAEPQAAQQADVGEEDVF